jgi:predicted Zn-dependent peptidase
MHEDDPGDAVHDLFADVVWPGSPLGRPVLGTIDSINGLRRAAIAGYYHRRYRPENLVVAAAGNIDHGQLVRLVRKAFANTLQDDDATPAPPRVGGRSPSFVSDAAVLSRPTEQANLLLGAAALPRKDDRRFTLGVLNAALGGGMSSRLFQEVREKRGLAYSVYSFTSHYADTGVLGVYAGCHPQRARDVLELCREQVAIVATQGLTADEVERGKGQLRGGIVLGLEDTGSRMSRLGKSELVYGELLPVDEMLARIDEVTLDDVHRLAADLLAQPMALAAIGPNDDETALRASVA